MEDNTPIFVPSEPSDIPPAQGSLPPEPGRPRNRNVACLVAAGMGLVGCALLGVLALVNFHIFPTTAPASTAIPVSTIRLALPTSTRAPSPTPDATQTQLALHSTSTAAAIQATATQAAGWKAILDETFDKNTNGWRSGHFDSPFATIDFAIQEGVYRWDGTAHQGMVYTIPVRTQALTDFFMSADVRQVGGTPNAEVGLGLRQNGSGDHYYFTVSESTRKFSFQKWMNEEWSVLLDWDGTSAIHTGEWNRLAVLAQGSRFTLFINDQLVGQPSDDSIAGGINLLGIGIDQADLQGSFEFDNVTVRVPGK